MRSTRGRNRGKNILQHGNIVPFPEKDADMNSSDLLTHFWMNA